MHLYIIYLALTAPGIPHQMAEFKPLPNRPYTGMTLMFARKILALITNCCIHFSHSIKALLDHPCLLPNFLPEKLKFWPLPMLLFAFSLMN
jgi:hypothetical protein